MNIKKLILTVAVFLTVSGAGTLYMIPKTVLVLPEQSAVKINWILLPGQKDSPPQVSNENVQFVIDYENKPIMMYNGKLLFKPINAYLVKFKQNIRDIICLDNGILLFSDGKSIGYAELEKKSNENLPVVSLKPIAKLPHNNSRIFKGDDCIYALSLNPKTKKYEAYLFNPVKKAFEKIISLSEQVSSLSGKGNHIFLSIGRQIREYKNGRLNIVYEHPRQSIKKIFYSERAGLLYETENGIGFVKDGSALEFLQSENFEAFLKAKSIYVFFVHAMAVAEFANIDDLKNYSFKIERLIDINRTF
ncbi:hypothetical protein V4D30_04875 [Thermodesulfovibrio sp. 3907-1M]|uniref:6-bladed beta-propeller n=1 Tax=Thermodesulfovibrio autotrophicus TaxID=3118333 RepID=A0AAU8H1E6_9BACT